MKLLLTSGGVTNAAIREALIGMLAKNRWTSRMLNALAAAGNHTAG